MEPNQANVLNRSAPKVSIYKQSLDLLDKLACIDGFEPYFENLLVNCKDQDASKRLELYRDPMQLVWEILQKGVPLCILYNSLRPQDPILIETTDSTSLNAVKRPVYSFLKACKDHEIVPQDDLFTITELFKDDTNSFVKVLKTVLIVVDRIETNGYLGESKLDPPPSSYFMDTQLKAPIDNRDRIVRELVDTERKYVQDLELLQGYMIELQSKQIVSNNTLRYIFSNLNHLVDFQRRCLIGIEANAPLPINEQRFGALFQNMEEAFSVYEPYCANYDQASQVVVQEANTLAQLDHIMEPRYELPSMLIKPIQRICKYPLIFREMVKLCDGDPQSLSDLEIGFKTSSRITDKVNEARRREANDAIVRSLETRLQDSKGVAIAAYGRLHIHDSFIMSTNDASRELQIFLFEKILICCKEVNQREKRRSRQGMAQSNNVNPANQSVDNKCQLKLIGRIFLHTIHRVVNASRLNNPVITVFWRDIFMENFSLKCKSEDQLNTWKPLLENLIDGARNAHLKKKEEDSDDDNDPVDDGVSDIAVNKFDTYESDEDQELKANDENFSHSRNSRLSNAIIENGHNSGINSDRNSYGNNNTNDMANINRKVSKLSVNSGQHSTQNEKTSGTIPSSFRSRNSSQQIQNAPNVATVNPSSTKHVHPANNGVNKALPNRPLKLKVHFGDDIFVIAVKHDVLYLDLLDKVERKIRLCAAPNLLTTNEMMNRESLLSGKVPLGVIIRYTDEDGDLVLISSDEDVQLAFESADIASNNMNNNGGAGKIGSMITLNVYASIA
ncbi:hypothetical protein BB561_000779 [Smittium simulii]|uniref:DH domain-containing protein n=1 Tax=Smittium simulii TaxID=133385 RepID=A0A2T9YXL6_9FUNG|nr:hypothetical protein BB561_000779 [Smittium simulii]